MKIAHISDIHKTGKFFVREWGDNLVDLINEYNPNLLVISGDITDDGYLFEYEEAFDYLNRFSAQNRIIVPGNHDARNGGYEIFEKFFNTRYPLFENNEIVVLGIDSSEPDLDDGHIGRANYSYIQQSLEGRYKKLKAIVLHHHLIPIPGTGRERHIPVDSGDMLKLIKELDINMVFSGHKHLPWIWNLDGTYFITSGTSASRKLKGMGYPSFNKIHIEAGKVTVKEHNMLNGEETEKLATFINKGD